MNLILTDFSVHAGQRRLLHLPELALPATGLIGIIGPNGAGKSTLLHAMAGLVAHAGTKTLDDGWPAPARIGFLPQNFAVSAAISVAECVLLGRREQLGWRVTTRDRAEVARALEMLDLSHLAGIRMDCLSGGQQQRVLLAQRLLRHPRLLLLDEPTSALDMRHQLEVLTRLKSLSQGMLVIAALHDLTLAGRFADHLVLLEAGTLKVSAHPSKALAPGVLNPVYGIHSELLLDQSNHLVVVAHRAS
ncbi:ABC transporter ATP-binding protein [Antarcticimicrobium luteum]|uniref:ABC transporter ATP-binding protein n=1 Tax=Antarcticimicrobium luteum TaxID=2547397 RepID=A0A4R5UTC2_9RHOB|nr:ABC transporter ATP-binding protein [Antarcticimicrobium luteum]TDK42382.1 ABC transporter ATP-binding protein [Antarcticimicrobium luteum]